jgi:hypothetical protein
MRKVLAVFIAGCLVLSLFTGIFVSMPSARADIAEGDYTYTVAGSNATITGYTGSGSAVVIPDTLGGYVVTSIGYGAFGGCSAVTIIIPNSITSIGTDAFYNCTKLTSVIIGSGLTTIGPSAFPRCSALTSVIIPDSVTSIGYGAFADCSALTTMTIPNSVTSIGTDAFYGCTKLTTMTIPKSVTSIGSYAFGSCSALTAAHFSGNPPKMDAGVFDSCATGFTVWYMSGTTGWTNPWYTYPTATIENTTKKQTVLVLHIGKSTFTINGARRTLDSPPVIKNGRTLVPIRVIIEALGGTVAWDATTKKATVTLGKKTIVLWIGKSTATVNGVSTLIDSTNAKVVPEIINGRTMLPLRFVAENLGATVGWDQNTQTITITYTP